MAQELLGTYLVLADGTAHMITEVEAYDGEHDKACHASRGCTPRNAPMYGAAGQWYVYLCYGMYDMLNIVTGKKGYPAAVLIRGVEGLNGPGKLTKALGITRTFNTCVANKKSGLWIEDRGVVVHKKHITAAPRIGVAYAQEWARKPYRFIYTPQ